VQHPVKTGTVTIAGKMSLDVPPGTLGSILKHAGLKRESVPSPTSQAEIVEVDAALGPTHPTRQR
jgi:hypothetical protein